MKNKYPIFSDLPYRGTKVSSVRTKAQIVELLEKNGINNHQWTKIDDKESIKFLLETIAQGKQIKKMIQIEIPTIKAYYGQYRELKNVNPQIIYRILYFALKSILETSKYGIMSLEELLFGYTLTQLPDGRVMTVKKALEQKLLLPEKSFEI